MHITHVFPGCKEGARFGPNIFETLVAIEKVRYMPGCVANKKEMEKRSTGREHHSPHYNVKARQTTPSLY
jgi:hypothetical protein